MARKNKPIAFDSDCDDDSDWDDLSIASSELSELDSDVASIGSLASVAESYIADRDYKNPAQVGAA